MTNATNVFKIEPDESNNDVWDNWVNASKDPKEILLRKSIKNLVFNQDLLYDYMFIRPDRSECEKILNLILNHCDDNEKPRHISLERVLEIIFNMKPEGYYKIQHGEWGAADAVVYHCNTYKVKNFLKEVDEYEASLQ